MGVFQRRWKLSLAGTQSVKCEGLTFYVSRLGLTQLKHTPKR